MCGPRRAAWSGSSAACASRSRECFRYEVRARCEFTENREPKNVQGGDMADGYDRFENEGGGGGSFMMGLLTGTVLGAGLGMLFAPKAGSELRSQLSDQAGNLANQASEGYRRATESASEWADRGKEAGKEIYGKAREAVTRGA